ncbi:ArsR/SmtB family transcription factor [Natronospira bacteriovora]|uniref:Metalloregulator ArsR/SmtB family transcription factor n=1 Tax=Natronospira bacteriovora TaxID=3069753 RepID=A0ABU0W4Y4_9GAMM|nr:metalloregulator ArsR/SmtB family transcription factor [Natronospira sp. AB-CW4]MDQ2069078.1 metalloregulator ArsR/SmtB family transcription factor [Natronospira sp. AB-CW4]
MNTRQDRRRLADIKPAQADKAAGMLRTLANPCRLMILCQLIQGEKTVSELHDSLTRGEHRLGQSALSQHLARLRREKLVTTRRASQNIHYRIADPGAMEVIGRLYEIYCTTDTEGPVQHLSRAESLENSLPTGGQDEKTRQ